MVESAIIAKPCPVLGERVHAVIVTRDGGVSGEALRAWCAERLSDYKVPETIDADVGAAAAQRQWQGDEAAVARGLGGGAELGLPWRRDAAAREIFQIVGQVASFDIATALNFACDVFRHVFSPVFKRVEGEDLNRIVKRPDNNSAMMALRLALVVRAVPPIPGVSST